MASLPLRPFTTRCVLLLCFLSWRGFFVRFAAFGFPTDPRVLPATNTEVVSTHATCVTYACVSGYLSRMALTASVKASPSTVMFFNSFKILSSNFVSCFRCWSFRGMAGSAPHRYDRGNVRVGGHLEFLDRGAGLHRPQALDQDQKLYQKMPAEVRISNLRGPTHAGVSADLGGGGVPCGVWTWRFINRDEVRNLGK